MKGKIDCQNMLPFKMVEICHGNLLTITGQMTKFPAQIRFPNFIVGTLN